MRNISEANQTVLKILKRFQMPTSCTRKLYYCVEEQVEDGILLYNLLTRELVLLTEEEYQNLLDNNYLQKHWFVVPEDTKEKEYIDLVRWMLSNQL